MQFPLLDIGIIEWGFYDVSGINCPTLDLCIIYSPNHWFYGDEERHFTYMYHRYISSCYYSLYIELINIEYRYYVYREQEKEEQRMIKEQMKQEAMERKLLEEEKKKLESEERKFKIEMETNKELLSNETDHDEIEQLKELLRVRGSNDEY